MRNSNKQKRNTKYSKNNSNVWIYVILFVAVLAVAVLFLKRPKYHNVDGYRGIVESVVNGNTIKLSDGLTVELLGIDNTYSSEMFLKDNVTGRPVVLRADRHDPKQKFKHPDEETVRAYVRIEGATDFAQINSYILKKGMSDFKSPYCQDSSTVFASYVKGGDKRKDDEHFAYASLRELTSEELGYRITPATILMISSGGIGTGFFINERGLALTNYHVIERLARYDDFKIFLCDSTGKVWIDQDRNFDRLLISNKDYDFAIFTVKPDEGERFPCLPLAKQRPERGTRIGVVGHPRMQIAKYTSGQISSIDEDRGELGLDVAITNGNSGGPVCNFRGEVVAIAKSAMVDNDGHQNSANLNFGVDIMVVRETLDALKADIAKSYAGK